MRIENAKCVKQTDNGGLLIEAPDFDEPTWIPQKGVHEDSEVYKVGTEGVLIVEDWLAEARGWE
jgi:hypothetical protein